MKTTEPVSRESLSSVRCHDYLVVSDKTSLV